MREIRISVMDMVAISEQKEKLDKIFIDVMILLKCTPNEMDLIGCCLG
jgi:hypothetical protein